MRSFLLLLLSLMKGCEAWSTVKGCPTGWVEFTCKYTETNRNFQRIDVVTPKETITIKSTERNVWENKGRVSLYHDAKNKNLIVAIKQLEHKDFGEYKCQFKSHDTKKLILDKDCQGQFIQTAYRTAKTTITCDHTGNEYKFFCKQNGSICEDILSTKSSLKSNGTFTLTETNSGFSVSISNVSSHDAGVYWCGVETHEGSYRAALRKIQLEVEEIKSFTRSPTIGQDLTYWCQYSNGVYLNKFICKGEDPSICQPLVSIAQRNKKTGKFSMEDEKSRENVTITVREVTTDDTGTYWCGAETTDKTHSNKFFQKLVMTVVSPTSSTTLVSSTPTTVSAESRGDSPVIITVIVCVAVLLLLLLIFILIYKRYSHSKNTRKGAAAQNIREDYVYEEIQQPVQAPDSGIEMNTIYANANFPTNPSASLHYSTINFQSSSDRADGEAVILKPSSAACEYSTVKQSETYSTVNQPSSSSEDPLYTTVNKPQQH
ncbi:polymeric immunoglobulin receptor-like [Micropterus dolomieu]|uniref:polymeric immunoglobulin receptor-like n=1 Tax=Micropterus dolomieu TaxID=147949 RepID=UPI001E8E3E80|nr:polymeric immunoglobulin receptor-like [Micropterus dolomieu]